MSMIIITITITIIIIIRRACRARPPENGRERFIVVSAHISAVIDGGGGGGDATVGRADARARGPEPRRLRHKGLSTNSVGDTISVKS